MKVVLLLVWSDFILEKLSEREKDKFKLDQIFLRTKFLNNVFYHHTEEEGVIFFYILSLILK